MSYEDRSLSIWMLSDKPHSTWLQAAHSEAESIKLQDALIREEEEAERLEDQRQAARLAADRERKARKKVRNPHLPKSSRNPPFSMR